MSWDALEEKLQPPSRSAKRDAASERALRDYFGDEEFDYLQKLASHAQMVRSRAPVIGNVVFLHGIMGGSLLTVESDGDVDDVWLNLFRIAFGDLERLRLTPDGAREADSRFRVITGEQIKRYYARAVLWLRARWKVFPFSFDWRKDLDTSSHALADFIREKKLNGQTVHLVAHSMGGLVSRNFIRLHRDVWDAMHGRLIMLGTPNYGSYEIPLAFTGENRNVRLLEALDFDHNMNELLAITNSFVGSYQMLPSPVIIPTSEQAIYRTETWGKYSVSATHLRRAFDFHYTLEQSGTTDKDRMVYIAGCNQETAAGLRVAGAGEFEYSMTYAGDGSVPHALGLLKDVPTYYVDEEHSLLAKNEKVLSAVDELLGHGRTTQLSSQPIIVRAAATGLQSRRRSVEESRDIEFLRAIADKAKSKTMAPRDLREAEEILGTTLSRKRTKRTKESKKRKTIPGTKDAAKLEVVLEYGYITKVKAPVVAVGHYKGIAPVAAEGAIDRALDSIIYKAGEKRMIGGELGEIFCVPVTKNQLPADVVTLACMGEPGQFTQDKLRYLMGNVAFAISGLQYDTLATVLIGSGNGSLPKEIALKGMLEGIGDALVQLDERKRMKRLIIAECWENHVKAMQRTLENLKKNKDAIPTLQLSLKFRKQPGMKDPKPTSAPKNDDAKLENRITVERDGEVFRFSALTHTAVIPVRESRVQSKFVVGMADRLRESIEQEEQEKYGRLLATYLVPEDFGFLLEEGKPLTLVLDRSTAAYPWEMGCFVGVQGKRFFGPHLQLTRQFRSMLSSSAGKAQKKDALRRVLIIADPAPDPDYQLAGARSEGRMVAETIRKIAGDRLEVVERIGAAECDPVELLALLFNEDFDILHYAGHGQFDEKYPDRSGWVFGKDLVLSAQEIFRARRVPRLVFANACFSAVTREGKPFSAEETNRQLAGLAEAFFDRGVLNYIGAGWPVDDEPAVAFAESFYTNMLGGDTLGASLAAARRRILDQGSTWGAYHHYGQVNAQLFDRPNDEQPPSRRKKDRRKRN